MYFRCASKCFVEGSMGVGSGHVGLAVTEQETGLDASHYTRIFLCETVMSFVISFAHVLKLWRKRCQPKRSRFVTSPKAKTAGFTKSAFMV
jgi:hypothetical protein